MKPLISIVTPVYNSFDLMGRYLNSLKNQQSDNFEVIIVDDHSSDGSYKKLKDYKFPFKCYLFQTKKNSGPGVARNLGLAKCSGEYVTFVDSDDYVDKSFIEVLTKTIKENDVDAIVFDYYKTDGNNNVSSDTILLSNEGYADVNDVVALSTGSTWCKVYKTAILKKNKIAFPNLMRSEDLAFNKVALSKCSKIFYLKKNLYYYFENTSSIMHNPSTLDINNNKKAFQYIEENIKMSDALEMIFIRECLYLITQIMILKKEKTKSIKAFILECETKYPNWYNNKYIKMQPRYLQIILLFIKCHFIFPIRIIFKLKK